MQGLTIRQLMKLSRILKKMGFKINLTDYIFGEKFDKQLKEMESTLTNKKDNVFINIVVFFIENMYLAENELIELLSDINKKSIKEIESYSTDELINNIQTVVCMALPKNYQMMANITIEKYKKKIISMMKDD